MMCPFSARPLCKQLLKPRFHSRKGKQKVKRAIEVSFEKYNSLSAEELGHCYRNPLETHVSVALCLSSLVNLPYTVSK